MTDIVERLRKRAHNGIAPMPEQARLDMIEAAAEIERLRAATTQSAELVTAAYGQVWRNGALVMCEQFDREPCPHQPQRRCGDCPARPA